MRIIIWLLASSWAFSSPCASTAEEIRRLESGGPLAVDPNEGVVAAPKDMKLILCIGQSNMAGRGKMTDEDRATVPNAYKLNRDGKWVAAKSPYHFDRAYAGVGPVDGFVKRYLKDHPGETVGVVPCAVGGSAMKTWDCTRSGKCGANLRRALARAHVASSNGTFVAVLWHQGETDAAKADAESLTKTYPGRVKAMMERLRTELGAPNLPLVVGEIGRWPRKDGDHAARINPAIGAIPALLPCAALATSDGLANQDAHHFDRTSQYKLADRYYAAWREASAAAKAKGDASSRERPIPQAQGTHVDPQGHSIEVTTKCIRIDGKPTVGVMGEMHYSRVPADEWRDYAEKMKAGGVTTLATYVFWNHHEWTEGSFDFTGQRDLGAFLKVCEEVRLPVVLRLGPWCHGEAREGGFPDWLVGKGLKLRSTDKEYLGYVERFWREVFKKVDGHLYKQGGCVVGVQIENECRGPWSYMMALKRLAVKIGFDVPYYTRTGWPKMNGKVDSGEILPLFGDYADGFWERKSVISPGSYRDAFVFKTTRTSANIATEQLKASELGSDAKDVAAYPYLTCELGGGMPSSYQRRLQTFPMDALAMAVVKLGSGSNLLGYYMYAGGTNPNDPKRGMFLNEEGRGRFTNHNDLPPFSYEFNAPIGEFGDLAPHYCVLKELHAFCAKYGAELALADPVIVLPVEARRGRFVFHNEYVRGKNPDGACWIGAEEKVKVKGEGEEKKVEVVKVLDCNALCRRYTDGRDGVPSPSADGQNGHGRRWNGDPTKIPFRLVKSAEPFEIETKDFGGKPFPLQPKEETWSKAAVYELDLPGNQTIKQSNNQTILSLDYLGDVARVYIDDVPVADDFYKGLPMKAGLWRYPKGKVTVRILPWQDSPLIYVQEPFRPKKTGAELLSARLISRSSAADIQASAPCVARWKGNRAAALSFTFDDGIRDQYELAFPKMKELGIKGTFFLNGGPIESQKPTRQGALRMTWEMVKEMSDAGMEMSNHGLNHANHGRTSREAVEVDIASNDVLIARHTGKKPITYAYPNNAKNKDWSAAVVNPGRVGSRTRQTSFGGKHTVESGRKLFKKVKGEHAWLVLMTHAVKRGYDQWRDPECFYALLADAAHDKDLWVDTFAAVAIYERLRNETKVAVTKNEKGWHVSVTPPPLDKRLFAGTLDLVLPDGTIRPFDPFTDISMDF